MVVFEAGGGGKREGGGEGGEEVQAGGVAEAVEFLQGGGLLGEGRWELKVALDEFVEGHLG